MLIVVQHGDIQSRDNMFTLACPIPHDIVIACSGGPDSAALTSFCLNGRKNITVLHIDHGTSHAKEARTLVENYCNKYDIPLSIHEVPKSVPHTENDWREFRLSVYAKFTKIGLWVATAHHLDDAIEWNLLTTIHGAGKFMQPIDPQYKLMKPFLFVEKSDLIRWCDEKKIPYILDPTNIGCDNARAVLRKSIIPNLLKIHPGMKTSIKNKMLNELRRH